MLIWTITLKRKNKMKMYTQHTFTYAVEENNIELAVRELTSK